MENNKAFVATLQNIRPIEGADKIVQASVTLNGVSVTNAVVGVDTVDGTKIVYFDSNLCLEETTILKDYPDLARYLGKRGRVKTVKLRGVYSDGLCVELDKFQKYDKNAINWEEGFSFDELNGKPMCHKYQPPIKIQPNDGSKKNKGKGKVISRIIPGQFNFHIDTDQLPRNIHKLDPEDVISISSKAHGTSSVTSHCLVKKKLNIFNKFLKLLGADINTTEYDYIYSSRRVVKNGATNTGFYATDIWTEAGQVFKGKLAEGETVYYEIVGYQSNGAWIQKNYDYGCKPGEHKVYVYRITKTSPDGHVTEYGWAALKDRCRELLVEYVPEYYFGKAKDMYPEIKPDTHWHENFLNKLREDYLEKPLKGNLSKKVPDEGIVLRIERGWIDAYKLKSLSFLKHEVEEYEKEESNLEDEN